MEKRIKSLYIVTIIAIIAFLGMQTHWIYGRYDFALKDYERNLGKRIELCVEDYNATRDKSVDTRADSLKKNGSNADIFSVPTFSLKQEYGDTVKTTRTSKIYTYQFSAHELLGLEPEIPLTEEQRTKAMELANIQMIQPIDSLIFDASGAKDESEAWRATSNVHTERKCPFRVEGIDSVLKKYGIKAKINLIQADSMVWETAVKYHPSVIDPGLTITIPYSQLQGKTVSIFSRINPLDVLPGMWQVLVITLLVSVLLIDCLILQFSTVLKLSRLDKMRNSFITTMIHELKRPLSMLKMCVSGLENKKMMADSETRSELLGETRNALDNLSAYFSKLRDITFNNVEQIPLNIQYINLRQLFNAVSGAIAIPSDKSVTFTNDINDTITVLADPSHMFNILTNLVENAIKYSGANVEIHACATTERAGYIEIHISDNGTGIAPDDRRRIFDRFYRGKNSYGDIPGMGLGLAYVKLLVDAHSGEISVDSNVGEGSCFTISLPR